MITEANWKSWKAEDLKPYVHFCLEEFGAERLMFGSDWPVCKVAGSYSETYSALSELTDSLSQKERNLIFGRTAKLFYHITE